jgi:acetoacetate decarboxylase
MNREAILRVASMPAASPAYPHAPYRFVDRESLIIIHRSDPMALRRVLPEPLTLAPEPLVTWEWARLARVDGTGESIETTISIACVHDGEPAEFIHGGYRSEDSAIAAGREIWGLPHRRGRSRLEAIATHLAGALDLAGECVAMASLRLARGAGALDRAAALAWLTKPRITLKLMPGADGRPALVQLIGFRYADVALKGVWSGEARLDIPANTRAAVDGPPATEVIGGFQILADVTLPYGRVLHDYLR